MADNKRHEKQLVGERYCLIFRDCIITKISTLLVNSIVSHIPLGVSGKWTELNRSLTAHPAPYLTLPDLLVLRYVKNSGLRFVTRIAHRFDLESILLYQTDHPR